MCKLLSFLSLQNESTVIHEHAVNERHREADQLSKEEDPEGARWCGVILVGTRDGSSIRHQEVESASCHGEHQDGDSSVDGRENVYALIWLCGWVVQWADAKTAIIGEIEDEEGDCYERNRAHRIRIQLISVVIGIGGDGLSCFITREQTSHGRSTELEKPNTE